MNSILSMFYNLDDSNLKPNNNNNKKHFNNNLMSTPALNQGANFKNYQNKIKNNFKTLVHLQITLTLTLINSLDNQTKF